MYRPLDKLQHSFFDFNQPLGMHMNPKNRWIRLADRIPWDVFEEKYAALFPVVPEMLRSLCIWPWVL